MVISGMGVAGLKRGYNSVYRIAKIKANIDRDKKHGRDLIALGRGILRIWESDILASPNQAAAKIARLVLSRRGETKV